MEYAEDVMVAFLTLLVNSRNELALSRAMVSPLIDFTHEAFTVLKRISVQKDMPMCQTAVSYVTRIKLGGKGYAPPEDCPLRVHLKGMEQFVELLNQLQTVIEEDTVTESAIRRVMNMLKNRFLKCSSQSLRQSSVEEAALNLLSTATKILEKKKLQQSKDSGSQYGLEALHVLHQLVNYINYSCSAFDAEVVLEGSGIHRTPLNLPPLMGYFRSPEEELSCNSRSMQEEVQKFRRQAVQMSPPVVSYVHSHDSNSAFQSVNKSTTPLKTNFRNLIMKKDKPEHETGTCTVIKEGQQKVARVLGKRSILKDISNEKQNKPKAKKAKSSAQPKKKKQIEGQAQLTKFFSFRA